MAKERCTDPEKHEAHTWDKRYPGSDMTLQRECLGRKVKKHGRSPRPGTAYMKKGS